MMKRIHLISGPRNISTALMYSFGNRGDCSIVDEPLYAHYLTKTGKNHPGRDAVLTEMSTDPEIVIKEIFFGDYPLPIVFLKNMAHHILEMPLDFLDKLEHIFLIRDPKRLIVSFDKVYPNPNIQDIGLQREWELYEYLISKGHHPIVLDSGELLKNPAKVLAELCDRLQIPFTEKMLQWPPGPRKEDGSWAQYWYASVHKSTAFASPPTEEVSMKEALIPLYNESIQYYNPLFAKAIKA